MKVIEEIYNLLKTDDFTEQTDDFDKLSSRLSKLFKKYAEGCVPKKKEYPKKVSRYKSCPNGCLEYYHLNTANYCEQCGRKFEIIEKEVAFAKNEVDNFNQCRQQILDKIKEAI